ncbi:hypothetical protein TNCV_4406141 [Trichonephila clavipes]|nr:hypothetical protein TNCV_4406141 [Trichonephila clavipes]
MGCVSSVFQYGSYLVDESKNEAAPEVKEETENAPGDIPSTQELPIKSVDNETPIKVENVKLEEAADEVNDKTVEPTVTEFERLRETKIEKEKTIKDSGETTEKTVFTEISESVKVEEAKGPIADPFTPKKEKSKSIFPSFSSKSDLLHPFTESPVDGHWCPVYTSYVDKVGSLAPVHRVSCRWALVSRTRLLVSRLHVVC